MKHLFNDYVQSLETYIMFRIKQQTTELTPELTAKNRSPIALSMGAPVQAPPEFVINKLIECLQEPGIHTYSSPKGETYYLDAIIERMKSKFNVDINRTEVNSLIGSKEGIANLIRELINPTTDVKDKDIIMIPDPGYASYGEMIKVSGGKSYSVPLSKGNDYMPDFEETAKNLEKDGNSMSKVKALIINYPNNPLGINCTFEYLQKAVDFCRKHRILLISDAAYADMTFEGEERAHSVLECEGGKETAIEFYSFSKPFAMTGWRLGWACGNAEAVGMLGKLKSTIDSGAFKALQKAAAEVLNSTEGEEYIKAAVRGFEVKQKILLKGLSELGWNIDELNIPKASFYLWLPIPERYRTSTEFTEDVLKTSGIVLVPGTAFGRNGEGWFRISAVTTDEKLQEVIDRMKEDGFTFK